MFYNKVVDQETVHRLPFFKSRNFNLGLLWFLFAAATLGTYLLSKNLGDGSRNQAAAFFGNSSTVEISLFSDRAEPSSVIVGVGDEVLFLVKDESFHNMVEERTKRGDARLESGEIRSGESYSLIFQEKTSISFYDRLNPDIKVSVKVE